MIGFALAKINIGLYVISKREDGYHNIFTCMVPIKWFDVVEVIKLPCNEMELCVYGDFRNEVPLGNNTVVKAFNLLKERFRIENVGIHLLKQIPSEAGLGGASSDAATTINLLDRLFDLNIPLTEKLYLSEQIGSDVPFFIKSQSAIASGKGERLVPVDLPWRSDYFTIVIVPKEKLSTADMYAQVKQYVHPPKDFKQLIAKGPKYWKETIINQFESIAEAKFPNLTKIKRTLYEAGADYVSLSGSGSSYYGLFHMSLMSKLNNILDILRSIEHRCITWSLLR